MGYFALKSDKRVQDKVKNLLASGYIELTLENAKIYGDLFYKTKVGSINYFNAKLEMAGSIYIKGFKKSEARLTYSEELLEELGMYLKPIYKSNLKKIV